LTKEVYQRSSITRLIKLKSSIEQILDEVLTEIEKEILMLRFGLLDGKERTLAEVAKIFKLSPERIRQIESVALRKLKHPAVRMKPSEIIDSIIEEIKDEEYKRLVQLPVDLSFSLISTTVYEELIEYLARNPQELKSMNPRKFEEIIAHIFDRFGYEVELTKRTRDGGRDIIAIREKGVEVAVKYLIEAKRPEPGTPVRIGAVRELYGVKSDEKATKAILATTTFFTRDARMFFDRNKWELEPRDFDGIMSWIYEYLKTKIH